MPSCTKTLTVASVVVLALAVLAAYNFHGERWQRQLAQVKQKALWAAVTNDNSSASWPSPASLLTLFLESMNVSIDSVSDDMPPNVFSVWPVNFTYTRQKLIHAVGATAMCKWVSTGKHNYTGLFQGGDYGFIRFSLAKKPDPSAQYGFAPGIGLKFLRDYIPSSNFMAMYSLEGQSSFNFFKHDLTNHVPDLGPHASFALRKIRATFAQASGWPTMLGISDFAGFTQSGDPIPEPVFPFRLIFHPTYQYHTMFPETTKQELPTQLAQNLIQDTVLYYIYAQDTPSATVLDQIGYLQLTSNATPSIFADQKLFMQHVRMEVDLSYRPEWTKGAAAIIQEQQKTDRWTFADLPFDQ